MNRKPLTTLSRPCEYAQAILAEPSRDARKALLERCPEEWRALVRSLVEDAWAKAKSYRTYRTVRQQGEQAKPTPAPRVTDTGFRISAYKKSSPEVGNDYLQKLRANLPSRS
ncbi:hypothetical protein VQ643_04235 [Pseudomonas sp. F1_0610]|uniref:hypothetical protein n=1 Tax=Pseudomonas sp. F1_0610 TaxID=3114284 RepID=UPI0039C4DC1C